MEPLKTLVDVSDNKVRTIQRNNQTLCKQMSALLFDYGLTDPALSQDQVELAALSPITLAQGQGLTLQQMGILLKFLGIALAAIGENIAERTVEAELLEGGGYVSIDAAIADVPLRFTGDDAVRIARNLEMVKETISVLDAQISPELIVDLLNRVLVVRNNVVYAASQVRTGEVV